MNCSGRDSENIFYYRLLHHENYSSIAQIHSEHLWSFSRRWDQGNEHKLEGPSMIIRIFQVSIHPEYRDEFERDFNTISIDTVQNHKGLLSLTVMWLYC